MSEGENKNSVHVGTSGWHYRHWLGPFYPPGTSSEQMFRLYQGRFRTVEINNSFYKLPEEGPLTGWREQASKGFVFSVKASRYITHMKKLKDPEEPLKLFLGRMKSLGPKLGPILFQLPPRWSRNSERLESFLNALPEKGLYAFEFRDSSWFHSRTYRALAGHGAAFCIYDLEGRLSPEKVTAGFAYVRLHGPTGAYCGCYPSKTLSDWAGKFRLWAERGKEVFCYFDNDEAGYAAQNALELQRMLEGR